MRPVLAAWLLAGGLALPALPGCDAARGLEALGLRTIAEVPVDRLAEILAEEDALLVQRRGPEERLQPLPGATLLADDEAPPPRWRAEGRSVLVVAEAREEALALAARLRRAGIARVGVVTGDPRTLGEPRTARAAQPTGPGDHPSRTR